MYDKDVDPISQQEIALDDIHDIASLEEDYPDGNNNSDQDSLSITEIEYPELDDVEANL